MDDLVHRLVQWFMLRRAVASKDSAITQRLARIDVNDFRTLSSVDPCRQAPVSAID